MNRLIAILVLGIIFSFCANEKSSDKKSKPEINIMAYYVPSDSYNADQLPLEKLTHIIFSFSKVINGEMQFRNAESGEKLKKLVAQKQNFPHLKVMIACGGWGADGFSDSAASEESRQKFINSTIAFIEKYQLDGVDMDWEYPGIPAAGTKASENDKQNFTALMKGLREALDKLERPQTLTFASAGWKRYYDNVELVEVLKYANYMNVMTYDQAGGASTITAHHTALGHVTVDDISDTPLGEAMKKRNDNLPEDVHKWEPQSAEKIIDFCIKNGAKPEQLVVGAAFYGRGWKSVPPEYNGLYQPNKGAISGGTNYSTIIKEFVPEKGFTEYWDEMAKAPYLYNATDSIFVTYDNPKSVRFKTQFVKENKLGGIMFWQLSGDSKDENSLLSAIYNEAVSE